jgi:arabinogalactan oligomer/maltooligosaccharide transport system permease protein
VGRDTVVPVLAAVLLTAAIAAPAMGLARYLSARDARSAALSDLGEQAARLAEAASRDGEGDRWSGVNQGVDLARVAPGRIDAFGIVRDAEVLERRRAPSAAGLATDGELMERYASLRGSTTGSLVHGVQTVDGASVLWAAALIGDGQGGDRGMVRLATVAESPEDPLPSWRWIAALLLVAVLALRVRDRLRFGPLAGAVVAVLLAPMGAAFALGAGLLALVLVALAYEPLQALLLGLREQPVTYLYVAPAMLGMAVLVFVPFAMGVVLAFFDGEGNPVGVANFVEILSPTTDGPTTFYWTLGMTVLWTVSNVVLHVGIGLALALVLNHPDLRFRWLYRVLLIVPWAVPNYITALIWKWMFNTQYGAVNACLAIFGVDQIDWLGTSVVTNFLANLVTNTWLGFPFMMVVSLGALQSIPRDLYEAVTIDGASRWQSFRHVTLPLLKPAMVPAIILGTIWTFNMFNVIYLVSGGGPDHKTNILITEAYDAFKVLHRYGYAAAYSLLIFVVLFTYGAMTNRVTRATEGAFQ